MLLLRGMFLTAYNNHQATPIWLLGVKESRSEYCACFTYGMDVRSRQKGTARNSLLLMGERCEVCEGGVRTDRKS